MSLNTVSRKNKFISGRQSWKTNTLIHNWANVLKTAYGKLRPQYYTKNWKRWQAEIATPQYSIGYIQPFSFSISLPLIHGSKFHFFTVYTSIHSSIQLHTVIHSYVQFYGVIYSYTQLCTVLCSYVQFYAVIYSYIQLHTVTYSYTPLYAVLYSYMPLYTVMYSFDKGYDV